MDEREVQSRMEKCMELESKLRRVLHTSKTYSDIMILHPLSKIGHDCGAIVMLGFDHTSKQLVVVKDYMHEDGEWKLPNTVTRQVDIYETLNLQEGMASCGASSCIQECLDVQIMKSQTRFIFKYYPMSFGSMMQKSTPHSFTFEKVIELLHAVYNLHNQYGIAHRDIKAQNICFTETTQLILIDFDTSIKCVSKHNNKPLMHPVIEEQHHSIICKTFPVCTLSTRAPEQFHAEMKGSEASYDAFAGDWWAVGCVIAQMYLGTELFAFEFNPTSISALERHYESMRLFSEEWVSNTFNSTHAMVKTLRRNVPQSEVIVLLKGLLDMKPSMREQAVLAFLNNAIVLERQKMH